MDTPKDCKDGHCPHHDWVEDFTTGLLRYVMVCCVCNEEVT